VLVNVPAQRSVVDAEAVRRAVEREEASLRGRGRVLLRASGTEPLVRVMAEAPAEAEARAACESIVEAIAAEGDRPSV
jgi:phosphoglucosamine mutase